MNEENNPIEMKERDQLAEQAALGMDNEEIPESEPSNEAPTDDFDSEAVAGLVDYGLSFAEMAIQGACDVPEFSFDADKRKAFIEETKPLLDKYGVTWLGYFDQYKAEISFGLASVSLIGGSIMQVKRLQREKEPVQTPVENAPTSEADKEPIDLEAALHAETTQPN